MEYFGLYMTPVATIVAVGVYLIVMFRLEQAGYRFWFRVMWPIAMPVTVAVLLLILICIDIWLIFTRNGKQIIRMKLEERLTHNYTTLGRVA